MDIYVWDMDVGDARFHVASVSLLNWAVEPPVAIQGLAMHEWLGCF